MKVGRTLRRPLKYLLSLREYRTAVESVVVSVDGRGSLVKKNEWRVVVEEGDGWQTLGRKLKGDKMR